MKSPWKRLKKWYKSGFFKNENRRNPSSTQAHLGLEPLEVRTLLAANALSDAPDVEFQITDDWNSGHNAELVLTNDEASSYANWRLEFDYDRPITALWNAQVEALGNGHYRLTPPEWDSTLDSGEKLAIGFSADGSGSVPSNFAFGSESASSDEPAGGIADDRSDELTAGSEDPSLPVLEGDYSGNGTVDAVDYIIWRDSFGSSIDLRADGNANGLVDQDDYEFWRERFGNSSNETGPGQDPTGEPGPVDLPAITIGDRAVTEGDSGTTVARFEATLSQTSDNPVSVNFETRSGTATGGEDYEKTDGQIIFVAGEVSRTIEVRVFGDSVVEADEMFGLVLSDPVGVVLRQPGASATQVDQQQELFWQQFGNDDGLNGVPPEGMVGAAIGTILNDDLQLVDPPSDPAEVPVVSIVGAEVIEGDTGYALATFNVILSVPTTQPVTVDYHTMTRSAGSGQDFEGVSGQVAFAPGEITKTIDVRVLGDTLVEGDETFEVMLTGPVGAIFAGGPTNGNAGSLPVGEDTSLPLPPADVPTEGMFAYLESTGSSSGVVMDLTQTGAHNVQLTVTAAGELVIIGPFNGSGLQKHVENTQELLSGTSAEFLETRLPDPDEDPNQSVSAWMNDSIGGLMIGNAHLYFDAAGLLLAEKRSLIGGRSDVGYVVTSHRYDGAGNPVVNVIDNFDPSSDTLDFQYFANREFSIADSPDGVVISASPLPQNSWGEKTLLRGVLFNQLTEENFVFRFDQRAEDGFNRFGGTSETTPTTGTKTVPVIASPVGAGSATGSAGVVSSGGVVDYQITADWETGFVSQWTFTPELAVGSWQVAVELDGDIQNVWNTQILSREANVYVLGNLQENATVEGGEAVEFGFQATGASGSIQVVSESPLESPEAPHSADPDGMDPITGALSAFGTILDDDVDPPVESLVQVADVALYEGDSGMTQAIFTVSLPAASSEVVVLDYETQDGTATAGEDYQAVGSTLRFSPGETTRQVAVPIYGDTQFEPDESFSLVLTVRAENSPALPTDDGSFNEVALPKVAAYFPEWGIYGRDYPISEVPAESLTHFIYAFANLTASGQMVLFDSFAAVEKRFSADQSVSGESDLWSYPASDPRSQQTIWGNFNQVAQLKDQNPHLRTSIALGGWTLSGNFSSVLSTPSGRQTLADSIYDFLDTYTMFDGIDFDWEYPGGGGLGGNSESPHDGANYASLLSVVREKLDQLGTERGRYYEISVASPGGSEKIANFNLAGLKEHVDFFNVMTYDFHGTWENTTGHQAALQNDPSGYDIQTAIGRYLDAGVPRENIVLGAPLYTRAWNGVADGGDNGYAESASGAAPGTFESGNYDYKDLVSQIEAGTADWELNWDDDAQAAYLYSGTQEIFSSFETPGTIALKSEWAQSMSLGGMMFWDLSNDASGSESLIQAASDSWFEGKSFEEIVSASNLTFDNVYGGNGLFDLVAEAVTLPTDPVQIDAGEITVTATGIVLNDDINPKPEEPAESPRDPVTPPIDDHEGHDHSSPDSMAPPASSGDYVDITSWGTFHGSNNNSEHNELVGGRTAITTEAMESYNNLRAFLGLSPLTIEEVGQWAFANELTNNTQAWENDVQGVGLYYAMQGAKVGWIADDAYDPQILADIQRTARLGEASDVMDMVVEYGHDGFAEYLQQYRLTETFINTLKMEPHYGGWMHGRTHGWRSIEGVAIAHDVNHLTVLSWDQMQPFMNDTFDWPQWPALDVSGSGVIEYFQSMVVLGDPGGENLSFTQPSSRYLAEEATVAPIDAKLTSLLDAGKIAAHPPTGSRTPSDHEGTTINPLVTDGFNQPVPSSDWWSSVHFAKYGDPFSAPLHVHPLTVQLNDSGLLVGGPTKQSILISGPTTAELKTLYQMDLQLELFAAGQQASSFALDSYSDWSFTGSWQDNLSSTAATLALASPIVWLSDVDLANLRVGFNTASAEVELAAGAAQVSIAGRNYALYAPEGVSWTEGADGLTATGDSPANIAVALLPDGQAETRERFSGAAARPVVATRFDYGQAENPYSLQLTYEYDLGPAQGNDPTVVAFYPHLERLAGQAQGGREVLVGDYNRDGAVDATDYVVWSDTRGQRVAPGSGADGFADGVIDNLDYEFWKIHFGATPLTPIGEAGYLTARGTMNAVATRAIGAQIPARGVLPNLPDLLTPQQRDTVADLVRSDPQANDPEAYLGQWQDTYWSGKSMLKMMQLAQMADIAGEAQIRDAIVQSVQNTLDDWFTLEDVPGDRHFAYNETWNTLQGYPDSFGSAGDLNDHHFHYGYFVHAAALVGIYDPSWVAENGDFVDVLIADVANADPSSAAFPRLRNFSPMAGHSWASGHGAFASGNNQESSSEAMNFATGVMLWGEVSGSQESTHLGQMLYSLEAEAISQYWFDKYQTTYPDAFDVESVGMVWGDGAAHATWFSAEVEMIKGINFLPFHGGSLYLSEAAHDPSALLEEITELNDGPPDVWQGLLLQYEALVDPTGALAHYATNEFDYEEGQSPAHTYFWMTTLANLGTPTSAIRGDYALSAVFVQPGLMTYAAYNPTGETMDVQFTDGATLQVAPYSAATTTSSGLASVPPTDPPANNPADPGDGPTPLEDLKEGHTLMLVGQTFQDEYTDFIDGTGLVPAGSSHYGTFYVGQIEQGDDSPNAIFLDTVRDQDLGDYAMVALSFKDNTPAGGYGQMINQGAADFNSNAIWEALDDIRNGAWDPQIDRFAQTMASRPDTQFLVRVGYEVSLLLFAYNGDEHVVDWLNQQATAGVNVFENPDAFAELDRQAFIDAYNHIVDRIEPQAANVEFGYHPVRGFHDTQWLYPGEENVDWVGFSVFNNDVCMEVSGTLNCTAESIDPNLAMSMDFARAQGHEIVIAESTAQNPAASNSAQFIEYLDRLDNVVQQYDVGALVYINSDWPAHGWGPEWGDSRVEVDPAVEAFFLDTFGEGTRYVYANRPNSPVDPPLNEPPYDDLPANPIDPPTENPTPPSEGPDNSDTPPGEEVTYGFGLIDEAAGSAYDTTGFGQGEFVSNINFSHRATADPLVAPGNPNFWHAHDFFVNPSTDAYSTIESLMAVDGSSAQPANNESVYWVPSLINETSGEHVTPLDSSIAYYRIARPYDPDKLEAMPTGLSVIAGSAMPTERQSIGVVAWNYLGSSERYDHLPIGDEWQDLPLQALIYFPTFWDGENLDSANHKSHMAYAAGNGGPSTHPYLLPQLELQIHYGKILPDAQLVLTSDYMTQDHPDYAPGWSLHADHIHLPWPEFDSEGNLYDGFERRVNDSMRFPIFAGTDGNSVRTIPTGAQQPFTPEPFYTYAVFPGQDPSEISATTLPILVSSTPTTGGIDVPVGTAIELVFDEGVVAGEGMLHLMTGPADNPKTAPVETHASVEMFSATDPRVSINGNTVTITLANELAHDTTYHLDIGSGGDAFLDTAGNGYQRDHADYHFTTTDGVGVDFTIAWPGNDIWMGVGNTSTIYGQVHDAPEVGRLYATIQNVESGLYQRTDGTFGEVDPFEIIVNAYDGHWFFLYTPAAGGTYRLKVFAIDPAENVTSRNTTFGVHGDPPSLTAEPPVDDLPAADPPATHLPVDTAALELVAEANDVRLLVDTKTQLAYVQEADSNPILIRRADDYWSGDIPLSRDGATLTAAARDALGRLRVLDVGPWGPFAWILDESGMFIGEEGPNDSTPVAKEILFGVDLTNDGWIGEATETMPPAELPPNLAPGADVVADGVQVRLMTFNVYYASLGAPERIDGIAQAVADYAPDIASIQEMWGEKDQILAVIETKTGLDYAFSVGSNTWDGDILYRADRWRILEDGVVTYDGSRGMSHATLEHLETGKKMSVYGMHPLAGVSEDVHLRNIEMATAHMAARGYADEAPVVLLGDMNAHENSESMRLIRDGAISAYGQEWATPLTFADTFRTANGDQANGNTGFGVKIDYVYVEQRGDPVFRVEGASIRGDAPGGSDHFPVMAQVVLLG